MRRKSLEKANCPIARSLERVGEWWSILILRDALHGYTRFEEFRESLGVAPNILTTRLARQLHRTEDKLERVLQEVEALRDERARTEQAAPQ